MWVKFEAKRYAVFKSIGAFTFIQMDFLPAIVKNPLPLLICLFAGSDIASATEVQSRGEVLA